MNNITNKALVIAVGIFITVAITSGILATIVQMREVYSDVYQTSTSIKNRFSDFDKYDGTQKDVIDLVNAYNKYNGSSEVNVRSGDISNVGTFDLNTDDKQEQFINNNIDKTYNCSIYEENNGIIYIFFN